MNYQELLMDSCKKYEEASRKLAESESNYKDVDGQTKTKLAEAYHEIPAGPIEARKMMALFDTKYIEWQSAVSEARKKYLADRAEVSIQEKRWETARSVLSYERAKTKIL